MRARSLSLLMLLVSCAVGSVLTVLSGPLVGLSAPAGTLLALVRHGGDDGDDGEQETETIECSAEGDRGPVRKLLGAVRARWAV